MIQNIRAYLIVAVLGAAVIFTAANAQAFKLFGGNDEVTPVNGKVTIPLSVISKKANFYTYKGAGKNINFFVVMSSDGVIRAAFDACDVCYHAGKGYTQNGDNMVCNNCGMKIPTVMVNKVSGGCNPSPLKRIIEGDTLVIEANDIEAGARYF